MKISLAIKTLFRTIGKTVFTFLLIAVLTFSLFIQMSEYFKTAAEFRANVESYMGTGYVQYRPPTYTGWAINLPYYLQTDPRVNAADIPQWEQYQYPALSAETVAEIEQMPHISKVYKRYMTGGVSEDYKRVKEDATRYDYNARIILEGTLDQLRVEPQYRFGQISWLFPYNAYTLRDVKILAGDARPEEILREDGTVYFEARTEEFFQLETPGISSKDVESLVLPEYWRIKTVYLQNYIYGSKFQLGLQEGDRYVFVCRFERQAANSMVFTMPMNVTAQSLELYDWASEHACPAVWNITDAPENYLELPDYAPLQKLIDVTETDLNTFDVVYVDDVTAIRRVDEDTMQLREGRWLTQEDTENDAKVCVIDSTLAIQYNLKLGDTLALNLGHTTFEQFYSLGAIASVPERFSDEWTQAEFEIVGICSGGSMAKAANEPNWAYSTNTVFVPLSSLPLTEAELADHAFYPGELTIRVEDTWAIEPFLKKTAPKIEAMGLTLNFDDGDWMPVLEGYREAQRIPLIRILLLAFVTVTGLALSVYLFVSRKKKDYAIMRALGTPKGRSGRALLVPITVLSLAAMLAAAAAGLVYSRLVIGRVFLWPVLICVGGELVFTLFFAALSIRRMSKLPPLLLLQGSGSRDKKARKKQTAESVQGTLYTANSVKLSAEPPPITRRPASLGFRLRYVCRHIRRQGFKSLLAVLLAALMVGAVTQLASLRKVYNELRETTMITAKFVNSLSLAKLQQLEKEGLTRDVYYERTANINSLIFGQRDIYTDKIQIAITSDIDRFLNEECEIILGDGYTAEDVGKMDYVLAGTELAERYEIQPGDRLRVGGIYEIERVFDKYYERYLDDFFYSKGLEPTRLQQAMITRGDVYEVYRQEVERALEQVTAAATVIGTIRVPSGRYTNAVVTAGLDDATSLVGTFQTMPLIEFGLADNSRAGELRQRGEELTNGREGAFVMDTETLERVIRTSDLLNGLYLPVIALALLIGAAMCALMVLQTTKDAAIMRAQGTTKRTTRAILAMEQILLGVLGIVIGIGIMLAIKREAVMDVALQAGLFAVVYALMLVLGSFVSAALATGKNILELLQTKE